jgi:hypothetical protein
VLLGSSIIGSSSSKGLIVLLISSLIIGLGIYSAKNAIVTITNEYIVYEKNFWGKLFATLNFSFNNMCSNEKYIVKSNKSIRLTNNGIFINDCTIDLSHVNRNKNLRVIKDVGQIAKEVLNIPGIHDITLSNIGTLFIHLCDETNTETLTISADKNILPFLEKNIYNNSLFLDIKNDISFKTNTPIIFTATVKHLHALYSKEDTKVIIASPFKENDIVLKASEDSIITAEKILTINSLEVTAESDSKITLLSTKVTGHTTLTALDDAKIHINLLETNSLTVNGDNDSKIIFISGKTNTQEITLDNDSCYKAFDFVSNTATVTAKNDSYANIMANQQISYTLKNDSKLSYKGSPQITGTKRNDSKIKQIQS